MHAMVTVTLIRYVIIHIFHNIIYLVRRGGSGGTVLVLLSSISQLYAQKGV